MDWRWVGRAAWFRGGRVNRHYATWVFALQLSRGLKPPGYSRVAATRLKNRPGIPELKPLGYTLVAATRLKSSQEILQ